MRRKSDMWNQNDQSFLPAEDQQAMQAAAAEVEERLTALEQQLQSQYTSMSTYHQIAVQSSATVRAEARADLDREKATLIGLVERVRDECAGESIRVAVPASAQGHPDATLSAEALQRITSLEHRLEEFGRQVALCLRSQEELANSIAFMFEQQMRNAGFAASCADASV